MEYPINEFLFSRTRTSTTEGCEREGRQPALTFSDLPSFNQQTTGRALAASKSMGSRSHSLREQNHKAGLLRAVLEIEQNDQLDKTVRQDCIE